MPSNTRNVDATIKRIAILLENAPQRLNTPEKCQQYLRRCFGPDNHHALIVFDRHQDAVTEQRAQLRAAPEVQLNELPVESFILDPAVPKEWIEQRRDEANQYMKHLVALSYLMEERHQVERLQFLNARLQRLNTPLNSAGQLTSFWAETLAASESASLLRATAPRAYGEAARFVEEQALEADLKAAKWPAAQLTSGMRDDLKVQRAFAQRVDPAAGVSRWRDSLRTMKDHYVRGIGDKHVSLAISGSLLGLSILSGAGPAGLVIGGLRFGHGLLSTDRGRAFQERLFAGARGFFQSLGVKPQVLDAVTQTIGSAIEGALASKWGRRLAMGVRLGGMAMGAFDVAVLPEGVPGLDEPLSELPNEASVTFTEVASGDTLSKIAGAHIEEITGDAPSGEQVSQWVKAIQMENQLSNPDQVFPGQQLALPTRLPDLLPAHIDPSELPGDRPAGALTAAHSPGF